MRAREALVREVRLVCRRLPDLFQPGGRLIVGYSGGQDSTALLHAVLHWRPRMEVHAVHVDHALRPESATMAQQVEAAGRSLGCVVEVVRVDVTAYRRALPGWSVQQAARAARYHALAQLAERLSAPVVVAHSADDQAETVLLRLLRGTGLAGLGGMRVDEWLDPSQLGPTPTEWPSAGRRFRLARPLLRVARATTLAYCTALSLPVIEDVSNRSRAYTRNRVRLDLLPHLESYNSAIRTVLTRTADQAAEDVAALDAIVDCLETQLLRGATADRRSYDLVSWRGQPRAIQRRLLRRGLERLGSRLTNVRAAPIEDALDVLASATSPTTYHLPNGIELRVDRQVVSLDANGRAARPRQPAWKTREAQSSSV